MAFQFPEAWYLLPLVIVPFLITLQRYLNRQTVTVPSLFFLEKVLRKSRRREIRLWEILVELFFLLGLIFLLSRPVFPQPQLSHDRLLVLLDDSPSMRYHFIVTPNPFFTLLGNMLEENRYEQIAIVPLSQLGKKEPYTFTSVSEIERFNRLLPSFLHQNWSVETVREFLLTPKEQARYRGYDFIIYSDNKANHFLQKSSEVLDFPPLLNVADLPPTPTLFETKLEQENFFTRENLEMTITVDPLKEKGIFAFVTLDEETVFRKQVVSGERASLNVKFPVTVVKEDNGDSIRKLKIGLEKNGVVFQEHLRVIHVYTPKTLSLIPPDHPAIGFFQTLFAYDLERGNLVLSPNLENADAVLVLEPSDGGQSFPLRNLQKVLFFLNPQESTVRAGQILQRWGVDSFTVERKKTAGILDVLETPFLDNARTISAVDFNIDNYFTFHFFRPPDYLVASIQKQPIVFRSGRHAIFNGIGWEAMIENINPQHLVWIYEILFSFWGKKPVEYIYPQGSESIDTVEKMSIGIGESSDQKAVTTLFGPPATEFTSPPLNPGSELIDQGWWGWTQLFKQVNTFPILENSSVDSPSVLGTSNQEVRNTLPNSKWGLFEDWISLVILLEIILLGLVIYANVIRWRSSS